MEGIKVKTIGVTSFFSLKSYGFRLKNGLVKGKWYLVEVGQYFSEGEYIYFIKINDQIVKQMVNTQPTEFNNFVAYASNPWTRNDFFHRHIFLKLNLNPDSFKISSE